VATIIQQQEEEKVQGTNSQAFAVIKKTAQPTRSESASTVTAVTLGAPISKLNDFPGGKPLPKRAESNPAIFTPGKKVAALTQKKLEVAPVQEIEEQDEENESAERMPRKKLKRDNSFDPAISLSNKSSSESKSR